MTEPMSDARLAEIRERCDNTTPGPWGVGNETTIALDVVQTSSGSFTCTVRIAEVADDIQREQDADEHHLGEIACAEGDALFIAHAPQDIDDLLAEVGRLGVQIDNLHRASTIHIEQLEYARRAILADGYFTQEQVGRDIGPRITERLSAYREALDDARREANASLTELAADAKLHREHAERVRRLLDRERQMRMDAQAKVRRVQMVKTWTNEDGKDFVFADDLWAALEPEEKAE